MYRYDERKDVNDSVEESSTERSGDILGLSGGPVPKMPGDPSAANDPESVRRRRERAMEETSLSNQEDGDRQRSGATGIDMGSGGQGTHVSGD